jgi:hypothetical protein
MLFKKFHEFVLYHGMDPDAVHKAMLQIPEYRSEILYNLLPD